jgi:hypothetical protein
MKANKPESMPGLKLRQLKHESDTWKRAVGFIMDENIHLKHRLAEILNDDVDSKLLQKAEGFQNGFIRVDELIRFLRNEIASFDKSLTGEIPGDGIDEPGLPGKLKAIRSGITRVEQRFNRLKREFNNYFLDYTSAL